MGEVLTYITQYGSLPILLYIIYYLYKKVENLEKEKMELFDKLDQVKKESHFEIREIEKENLSLTYKLIAIIDKKDNNNEG